ncbi:hypothetical protein LWI29_027923 [Acer saccharum]|uniref:Phosphomannose isomerase type I catalytic domain-containing protein n=1 Tax=Acer saccharum TaxID=4024 RepID=A0AA39RJY7_ACESA|nr:hypothetical protein LWI29_027923 [Acer saccharum]KAK1552290.1 hypothetical protein Q3G72_013937 [Acer saccharum]
MWLACSLTITNIPSSNIHPDDTYAEFWVGTHESGPSYLSSQTVSLKSWILDFLDVLGDQVLKMWGGDLPFLVKIQRLEPVTFADLFVLKV